MGFRVEINSILRSDDEFPGLARGTEHPFRKTGSRVFFDDLPIWLTRSDWSAVAEIRVTSQTRTPGGVSGTFRVLRAYTDAERGPLTAVFRRMFAGGDDPLIYLLMNPPDFDRATAAGEWDPPSRAAEGFVHASPADQLTRVANKHYAAFDEVVVVALALDRVRPEVVWEPATGGLYPHIYGPVNLDAVAGTERVRKGSDGMYVIAPQLSATREGG